MDKQLTVTPDKLVDIATKAVGTEIELVVFNETRGVPVVVTDKGRTLHDVSSIVRAFEAVEPAPYRRRGTYAAADIASLLAWMDRNCPDEAPVFGEGAENIAATWKAPKLALHGIGNYSDHAKPDWHDFAVRYDFPVTLAWREWTAMSGEWMDQGKFAEFVEKHLYEFSEPQRNEDIGEACTRMIEALGSAKVVGSPVKMYEMARGVKLTVSEKVQVQIDRATGESILQFSEEHTGQGGRPVAIPKFFYIRIPIFFGEQPSLVGALLRYRNAGGGSVVWSYELFAPDLVVKAAFERACEIVKRGNRTLYLGTPDKPATL